MRVHASPRMHYRTAHAQKESKTSQPSCCWSSVILSVTFLSSSDNDIDEDFSASDRQTLDIGATRCVSGAGSLDVGDTTLASLGATLGPEPVRRVQGTCLSVPFFLENKPSSSKPSSGMYQQFFSLLHDCFHGIYKIEFGTVRKYQLD